MNAADELLSPTRVAAHPERVALLFGDERITYPELLTRVNRFANGLRALGIDREQRVMLMLKDSPQMVSALLGCIKAGGVAVPINVRASTADLVVMLNDSRAKMLLIDAEFLPAYRAVSSMIDSSIRVHVAGHESQGLPTLENISHGQPGDFNAAAMSQDDMAFWLYTSGTTGTPKAAVHLHHDVLLADRFPGEWLGVGAGDRIFATSKLFFAYSLGNNLFPALRLGATSVLLDSWPESASIGTILERHKPTIFAGVPTMYRNLLRDGIATRERFSCVRHCLSAGERLPVVLFDRWKNATGLPIIDGIGSTESIYFFLANRPDDPRPGSSGRPAPGAEVELRVEHGIAAPGSDASGVLWVKMDSIADRYWNQQARSNDAFVGSWFRTGDVYRRDALGFYFHEGRADDMLKISGQWVSPTEIEEHVLTLTQVADAAVVGAANADGLVRLALFIVPNNRADDPAALVTTIQDALSSTLSIYKCPREVHLIDEVPRTATGKVQRFKLRARLDSGMK
ncbi:MAG: benzoate-CoA ligase family protein [Burkholderiales bacterium]